MADSPALRTEGPIRVSIFCNGTELAADGGLISVSVRRAANQVPSARLVFADGDMPQGTFPLSDQPTLVPGVAIRIDAGYGDDGQQTLFEGIVVKHGLHIGRDNDARLIVECRDRVVRMTVGRRNASYPDQRDSDLMARLIGDAGLGADVQATATRSDLVQYDASDWDFVLARAGANGMLVIATDGKVAVRAPDASAVAALCVTWGVDLLSFEADIDATTQLQATEAFAWDPKNQCEAVAEASAPVLNDQGNPDAQALARAMGPGRLRLQAGVPMPPEALQAWARARQLKAGLARIRGRVSFQGSARARVGEPIGLAGVGRRFSGNAFIGSLRHEISEGNWITEAEFGLAPEWFAEPPGVMAPVAPGLVPGIAGLHVGKVVKLGGDPQGEHRVQVKIPILGREAEAVWARLLQPRASGGFGTFFAPELDDEVVLGFFNDDPAHPVLLGGLHSSRRPPPYALQDENTTQAVVTRGRLVLAFDESSQAVTVSTPGGSRIVLSDRDESIALHDRNGNRVELGPDGITLDAAKDIKATARGTITIDAVGAVDISSRSADLTACGVNVRCEGRVGFAAKGTASAELSAEGQTTVRGALVTIN